MTAEQAGQLDRKKRRSYRRYAFCVMLPLSLAMTHER